MISFSLNLRKFHPRKSNPSFIFVMNVFSSDSCNPLCARYSFIHRLAWVAVSSFIAVTMKSSAYLMKFTLCFLCSRDDILPFRLVSKFSASIFCIPSSAMFANIGDMTPPCGVPSSLGYSSPSYTYPHLRNCFRTDLSIGIFSISHS